MEKSRTDIHDESTKQADDLHDLEFDKQDKIHADDTRQIRNLSRKLDIHCEENKARDKVLDERDAKTEKKIDKLLPLVNLIPTVEEIVENQKAMTIVGRKILRIIGYISAVIGLLYLIFRFWKEIDPR